MHIIDNIDSKKHGVSANLFRTATGKAIAFLSVILVIACLFNPVLLAQEQEAASAPQEVAATDAGAETAAAAESVVADETNVENAGKESAIEETLGKEEKTGPATDATPAAEEESEPVGECLDCHDDDEFQKNFKSSIHADFDCVTCHEEVTTMPHKENMKKPDCGQCHEDQQESFDRSIHGKMLAKDAPFAPHCYDCHTKHDIQKQTSRTSSTFKLNIPFLCGKCHKENAPVDQYYDIPQHDILEHYKDSIHGEGLMKKGLLVTATCVDCHSSHNIQPHTEADSTVNPLTVAKTCTRCHGLIEEVHQKIISNEAWEKEPGSVPACVDCHSPHEVRRDALIKGMLDRDCLKCHEGETRHIEAGDLMASVHYKIPCIKCHSSVSPRHERPCDTVTSVDCSSCHKAQTDDYFQSIHGQLHLKKDEDAPYCSDCHGTHKIQAKANEKSAIFRRNIPNLCAKCHRNGERAAVRYKGTEQHAVENYMESTHGKGVMDSGLVSAAVCIDCHTSHMEVPASDPRSSVNRANLAKTCAKCHQGIYEKFRKSVHDPSVTVTKEKLPSCADCHTAHNIIRAEESKFKQEVVHQCGSCHDEVMKTFLETYHGKAYALGAVNAAKCSDCHGVHDILRVTDPGSHLSRQNVVETCRKCHQGANQKFTGYLTHATHHNRVKYPILFFTFWAMTLLLVGTFAFFGVHTLLWLPKSIRRYREKQKMHAADENPKLYIRFKPEERLLHFFVIISFLGLAITGSILKFAYMPWAVTLAKLMGGVAVAGTLHRFCAIITFGYFAAHLVLLVIKRRKEGTSWLRFIFHGNSMLPNFQDAIEFFQTMRWFLGFGERPKYGKWTYWEKFDYFAVFWGITIIGASGLILWFPELFTLLLPGWLINVATIIHSDEALLAVGFIFTIHFFNTHLRPDVFPMDPVIFTGMIPLEELKDERPREYEEMLKAGKLDELVTERKPRKNFLRLAYIFGLTCLVTGITLITLIIYSMISSYL